MNYLTLENITKSYGEKVLFQDLSFHIEKGNKIAFVARNGTGKSTLLKIIAGLETAEGEHAKILLNRDARVGYLDQEPNFDESKTAMETIFDSNDNPQLQALKAYEEAMLEPHKTDELQEALAQMDAVKAWDIESNVKETLAKLSITRLQQPVSELSGGQRKRLAFAKLIIDEPDFLILDEPTNHLDLSMIEWIEGFLTTSNITIFMVTHDRYFLERVCNTIIELDEGTLFRYRGNYSYYLQKKAERHEIDARTIGRAKRLMKTELEWVRKMPQGRGTKAKARLSAFKDLKTRASKKIQDDRFEFEMKGNRLGKKIIELYNITKSFGDLKIIENFSYKFQRGERVGIVGKNGTGKSTFLKLLTEELALDSGRIQRGETIVLGHYEQEGIQLLEDKRVIEVIKDIAPFIEMGDGSKIYAKQFLERFLFDEDKHWTYVSKLSGGERRRLYLLTVLMKNPNFLILDEPTNDLDILTLNILEEFLMEYGGCLVMVSHDRYFMDKLVDHLFIFQGDGKVKDFNGSYPEYRLLEKEEELEERRAEREEKAKRLAAKEEAAEEEPVRKLTYQERKELGKLEKSIEKLEARKVEIHSKFGDTSMSSEKIQELSIELSKIEEDIEAKEEKWMELSEFA
ncbi:MAG: ABC-F family ATP-binding cassette domain-containing protein [Saprospiraceae bacterium]